MCTRDGKQTATRLSEYESQALGALVKIQQAELDRLGYPEIVTPSRVIKALIRKEAIARGVWPGPSHDEAPTDAPTPESPQDGQAEALRKRMKAVTSELMPQSKFASRLITSTGSSLHPTIIGLWLRGKQPIPPQYFEQIDAVCKELGF